MRNFIHRRNRNLRKLEAGIAIKRKGRPPKDYVVSEQDKVAELKYILARKEAKIIDKYIHFYNNERIQLKTKLTPQETRCQYVA